MNKSNLETSSLAKKCLSLVATVALVFAYVSPILTEAIIDIKPHENDSVFLEVTCDSVSHDGDTWTLGGTWTAYNFNGKSDQYDVAIFSPADTVVDDSSKDSPDAFITINGPEDYADDTDPPNKDDMDGTWSNEIVFASFPTEIFATLYHAKVPGNESSGDTSCQFTIPPTEGGLIVEKIVDNTGGGTTATSSFSFSVNGGEPIAFESDGTNELTLSGGDYTITEPENAHYSGDFSSCGSSGAVTVTSGATTTCTITNTFHNDSPVVEDLDISTDEDTPVSETLLGTDTDSDTISYAVVDAPLHGMISGFNSATGDFTYTPNADHNGSDLFTYKASDAYSVSNTGTVSITVNPVNDAPVANDDADSTNEDTSLTTVNVLTNDTDVDGDTLSVDSFDSSSSNGGTVTSNGDGTFNYTPASEFSGTDSFTYVVSDGNGGTDTATVTITVSSENDAPEAVGDDYSTDEDTPLSVSPDGVLGNDSDADGDTLSAELDTDVSNGTLTLNSDGSFDYTPDEDFNGSDSFTYHANDGSADSSTVTVTIEVNPVNDPPVADDDSISTSENVSVADMLTASDVDGDTLTFEIVTDLSDGTLTFFDADSGAFTYTPNLGFSGSDFFEFMANDGDEDSNVATISITVSSSPACSDTVDNDDDGLSDAEDSGCWSDPNDSETYNPEDNDETDPTDVCPSDEGIQVSEDECTPAPTPETPSTGGGGGGGGNAICSNSRDDDGDGLADSADPDCHSDGNANNPDSYIPFGNSEGGQVLGAFATGEVLGESCGLYMDSYIRSGRRNDSSQVSKLQTFLNKWLDAGLPVTGFYGPLTLKAVKSFQDKYSGEILSPWGLTSSTGIVYLTTLRQINLLECPELTLPLPALIDWSRNPNLSSR